MTDDNEDGDWTRYTSDELLVMLTESRRAMLLAAIAVLEGVTPQRLMHAGLEALRAALADLDGWAKGMAVVIERDRLASLGELRQH